NKPPAESRDHETVDSGSADAPRLSFRLRADAVSVLDVASSLRTVGARLDGAPVGAALRLVAAALPGVELARAASEEAQEWAWEMTQVGAVFEPYAALLQVAVEGQRRADAANAAARRR
ncbi:MAG: hypothetical protein WD794_16320, partial [Mycobacteriales bacterium]